MRGSLALEIFNLRLDSFQKSIRWAKHSNTFGFPVHNSIQPFLIFPFSFPIPENSIQRGHPYRSIRDIFVDFLSNWMFQRTVIGYARWGAKGIQLPCDTVLLGMIRISGRPKRRNQARIKSGTSHFNKGKYFANIFWMRARLQTCNYLRAPLEWEVSFGAGDPTEAHLIKSAGDVSVYRNLAGRIWVYEAINSLLESLEAYTVIACYLKMLMWVSSSWKKCDCWWRPV